MGINIKTKVFRGWKISYVNGSELDEMLNELYSKNYYRFQTTKENPVIYDVGALIGETAIFFKDQFPNAKIVAFEPSPRSFALLKKNVEQNGLTDVQLVKAAVARHQGRSRFYVSKSNHSPWGRGDSLQLSRFNNPSLSKIISVRTVRLSDYIKGRVDLLKLDIEGTETEVVIEIEPKLKLVGQIILEFHQSIYNSQNQLSTVTDILQRNGFTLNFWLGRWPVPEFVLPLVKEVLKLANVSEYWLRIYASRKIKIN